MDIAYAAHTRTCTFLLDSEGICRDVVGADGVSRHTGPTAERCIGAQYVASLDAETRGILVDMPRIGLPIVFARVDARGRVSLVRTGVLLRLEPRRASVAPAAPTPASEPPQPSAEYPVRREASVVTSAPHIPFTAPQDDDTLFEDARTQRFDLSKHSQPTPDPADGPETVRHAESRANRISDIVPKQPAATYEERISIFPPISPTLRNPSLDEDEPLSPYAIPLRRVR